MGWLSVDGGQVRVTDLCKNQSWSVSAIYNNNIVVSQLQVPQMPAQTVLKDLVVIFLLKMNRKYTVQVQNNDFLKMKEQKQKQTQKNVR